MQKESLKGLQRRTGHCSVEALRMYKRTSDKQEKAISRILFSNKETNFNTELENTALQVQNSGVSTMSSMLTMN